ncbi:hypothetical protein NWE55_08590 [Myroides albus]|nr:hypothetical protein [Myroides albus]UVD78205.1 hypothetical protein NWE55_08590 [Myroides albus]
MKIILSKVLFALLLLLGFYGCKEQKAAEVVKVVENQESKEVQEVQQEKPITIEKTVLPRESKVNFNLIIPAYYNQEGEKSVYESINDSWLEFREVNGAFVVQKAEYNLSDPLMNECTGELQVGVFSPDEEEPLIYFSPDNSDIKEGELISLPKGALPFWTENVVEYVYEGNTYTFSSTGKLTDFYEYTTDDIEEPQMHKSYSDYVLYLSVNGKDKQEILKVDSFDGTFLQVLFVGDMDGDGKLDFIFDTSSFYEEKSIDVYLSKGAKNYLYLASQGRNDFSC